MNLDDEIDDYSKSKDLSKNSGKEFSFGKVFQILTSTLALGLVVFLIVAILDYLGPSLQIHI